MKISTNSHKQPSIAIDYGKNHKPRKDFSIAHSTIKIKEDIIKHATDISDWEVLS